MSVSEAPELETGDAPETEHVPAPEPEPEPEPDDGDQADELEPEAAGSFEPKSEKEIEAAMGKLEREARRHRDRLSEIMGDEATLLEPCPLCDPNFAGFRFPVLPPDDVREAVRIAIGDGDAAAYVSAQDASICPECEGLGDVLTGSHVAIHRTKPCRRCKGAGWVPIGGPADGHEPLALSHELPPPIPVKPDELPDVDPWGRPRGHADYGRLPNYT